MKLSLRILSVMIGEHVKGVRLQVKYVYTTRPDST